MIWVYPTNVININKKKKPKMNFVFKLKFWQQIQSKLNTIKIRCPIFMISTIYLSCVCVCVCVCVCIYILGQITYIRNINWSLCRTKKQLQITQKKLCIIYLQLIQLFKEINGLALKFEEKHCNPLYNINMTSDKM